MSGKFLCNRKVGGNGLDHPWMKMMVMFSLTIHPSTSSSSITNDRILTISCWSTESSLNGLGNSQILWKAQDCGQLHTPYPSSQEFSNNTIHRWAKRSNYDPAVVFCLKISRVCRHERRWRWCLERQFLRYRRTGAFVCVIKEIEIELLPSGLGYKRRRVDRDGDERPSLDWNPKRTLNIM